jgi:hypothetical protein
LWWSWWQHILVLQRADGSISGFGVVVVPHKCGRLICHHPARGGGGPFRRAS